MCFILEKLVLFKEALKVFKTEIGDALFLIGPRAAEQDFFFVLRLL